MSQAHEDRVAREIANYQDTLDIHALPDIFHYWSNKYLAPALVEVFGSGDLTAIFASELADSAERTSTPAIVSVGAGDGSVEIGLASWMRANGRGPFHFDLLELSPFLIERGQAAAAAAGLSDVIHFQRVDLTSWQPTRRYGAAFAHHSLHHITALEHVFDQIRSSLADGGSFVTSDMIGRNGHMRWPETERLVSRIWRSMPDRYRYNHQLRRTEEDFVNWDCSGESFEGIRAQDILPELLKRFHFHRFCGWGGMTDIFTDRSFGHNLKLGDAHDQEFIDNLAVADRELTLLGAITPTSMIAVMRKEAGLLVSNGLNPASCVRWPD
jgi:SAM-dependent methyltransferase